MDLCRKVTWVECAALDCSLGSTWTCTGVSCGFSCRMHSGRGPEANKMQAVRGVLVVAYWGPPHQCVLVPELAEVWDFSLVSPLMDWPDDNCLGTGGVLGCLPRCCHVWVAKV